jgi:hypothetical protein
MEIYILIKFLISQFFDIRPNATNNPKGSEKSNVSVNIFTDSIRPSVNFNIITDHSTYDTTSAL